MQTLEASTIPLVLSRVNESCVQPVQQSRRTRLESVSAVNLSSMPKALISAACSWVEPGHVQRRRQSKEMGPHKYILFGLYSGGCTSTVQVSSYFELWYSDLLCRGLSVQGISILCKNLCNQYMK